MKSSRQSINLTTVLTIFSYEVDGKDFSGNSYVPSDRNKTYKSILSESKDEAITKLSPYFDHHASYRSVRLIGVDVPKTFKWEGWVRVHGNKRHVEVEGISRSHAYENLRKKFQSMNPGTYGIDNTFELYYQ